MDDPAESRATLEATTLRMFSVFFGILSVLVLVGTFFSLEKTSTVITSIATGSVLAAIAITARIVSRRIKPH